MKQVIVSFLLLMTYTGCRHDTLPGIDLPAFHIYQSEKLDIPPTIDLPGKQMNQYTRLATFYAKGVQKYRSQVKAGSDPATYEWVFVAPEADLYDVTNKKVGIHSAGPQWQLDRAAKDLVIGQALSPARTAPSPDPNSIDWLLLIPRAGTIPTGIFAGVSYIQRIATKGGKAPALLPTSANQTIDVQYTAVYRFSKVY